jgi:hypothetical protein
MGELGGAGLERQGDEGVVVECGRCGNEANLVSRELNLKSLGDSMTQEIEVSKTTSQATPQSGSKTRVKYIFGAVVAALMLWFIAPEESRNMFSEASLRLSGSKGLMCLEYERKRLKDPDSSRLLISSSDETGVTTITYKAKNSYGAYITSEAKCIFNSETRTVSDYDTEELRDREARNAATKRFNDELAAALDLLKSYNKCQEMEIKLLVAGKNLGDKETKCNKPTFSPQVTEYFETVRRQLHKK